MKFIGRTVHFVDAGPGRRADRGGTVLVVGDTRGNAVGASCCWPRSTASIRKRCGWCCPRNSALRAAGCCRPDGFFPRSRLNWRRCARAPRKSFPKTYPHRWSALRRHRATLLRVYLGVTPRRRTCNQHREAQVETFPGSGLHCDLSDRGFLRDDWRPYRGIRDAAAADPLSRWVDAHRRKTYSSRRPRSSIRRAWAANSDGWGR